MGNIVNIVPERSTHDVIATQALVLSFLLSVTTNAGQFGATGTPTSDTRVSTSVASSHSGAPREPEGRSITASAHVYQGIECATNLIQE